MMICDPDSCGSIVACWRKVVAMRAGAKTRGEKKKKKKAVQILDQSQSRQDNIHLLLWLMISTPWLGERGVKKTQVPLNL